MGETKLITPQWSIETIFSRPLHGREIGFVDKPFQHPEGLDEAVRASWDQQCDEKVADMEKEGKPGQVQPYHKDKSPNPWSAVYDGTGKVALFPGSVLSIRDVVTHDDGEVDVHVGQVLFPMIKAVQRPEVQAQYQDAGLEIPSPATGLYSFLWTMDGDLIMNVRGDTKVWAYQGRLYGAGGNPTDPNESLQEHQIQELQDEMLLKPEQFDPDDIKFIGIVHDQDLNPGKPDIVSWAPINMTTREFVRQFYDTPQEQRQPDSIGLVAVNNNSSTGLRNYLLQQSHPRQFCPPTAAGLVLTGHHMYGPEWAESVTQNLQRM
ncbi:hypothetical protein ACFL1B_05490 [Nanoarchaeota archaeon]